MQPDQYRRTLRRKGLGQVIERAGGGRVLAIGFQRNHDVIAGVKDWIGLRCRMFSTKRFIIAVRTSCASGSAPLVVLRRRLIGCARWRRQSVKQRDRAPASLDGAFHKSGNLVNRLAIYNLLDHQRLLVGMPWVAAKSSSLSLADFRRSIGRIRSSD